MPTMDYCAFENTAADMRVSLEKLQGMNDFDELDDHERRGLRSLLSLCREFMNQAELFDLKAL